MPLCAHRFLNAPDGSPCTSEEHPTNPGGHTYATKDGSAANDRHTEGGHG